MNVTVAGLRRSGYKVRVTHRRVYQTEFGGLLFSKFEAASNGINVSPQMYGGQTQVEITTPDGETLNGEANVYYKDAFNRKLGLKIALGRAMVGNSVLVQS